MNLNCPPAKRKLAIGPANWAARLWAVEGEDRKALAEKVPDSMKSTVKVIMRGDVARRKREAREQEFNARRIRP
jgi:hypothetical protein